MKRIININISKDTPEETITALSAALKSGKEKTSLKVSELYILNEDIEKLHERYEQLFKQVKTSTNLSETQIQKECETLSLKYDFEVIELSKFRKVDYDVQQAKIKAREAEQKPWRRCWLWRLIFQPLTNRAQDIIEKSEELKADELHSEQERLNTQLQKQIEAAKQLEQTIKEADKEEPAKVFNAEPTKDEKQLPGQLELVAQSLRDKQKK